MTRYVIETRLERPPRTRRTVAWELEAAVSYVAGHTGRNSDRVRGRLRRLKSGQSVLLKPVSPGHVPVYVRAEGDQ